MKRRVFCPWLLLLMLQNATASVVWDFGTDVKGTSVIAQKSGDIGLFEKDKLVTFTVPTCMEVKYVRVEVFNQLTTPAVTYNQHTHTVIISYKLLQLSISKYTIVAKGKRSRQCGGGGGGGGRGRGEGGGKILTPHSPPDDYYGGGDYNQHYESYNQYSYAGPGDYDQYQNQYGNEYDQNGDQY